MRLKRTEVIVNSDKFKFRYRYDTKWKEFIYEVFRDNNWHFISCYDKLEELPLTVQQQFTK